MQRYAAYVAFFLSGASSLIFQNIWSRMLHHVFGATTIAMSSVVTLFMAGLGLGAFIAGRYADRIKHPIITYAFAELGVGLWAMLIPYLVNPEGWLAQVNFTLRNSLGAESMGFMVARFLVVMPILLVPTTLMGTTLPLLARHFVQQEQRSGAAASSVGVLYAINTFGAVLGINLAGFILLPTVGLAYTNIVALSMNLILGIGIFSFRGLLLGNMWKRGEPLEWLPTKMKDLAKVAKSEGAPAAEPAKELLEKTKKAKKASKKADPDATVPPALETALPIPPIARKAAYFAFAASGAAALCYEVVWVRALSMTIGSSIYSFALILETFLIGIAGGSALCAAFMVRGRHRLTAAAVGAVALLALANVPWATGEDLLTYLLVTGVFAAPIAVMWGAVFAKARTSSIEGAGDDHLIPGLVMLGIPVLAGLGNAAKFGGHLSPILATVVTIIAVYFAVMLVLRRYPILLIAIVQLLIAVSAFANYLFQDEIPYAFASLVTTVQDLPQQVGTVQFFMFVTAGLCTLPAAIGMGAMFPLTIRVWTAGGKNIGRDVGVVYAGNTVGSIIGAWLPGFVLMPLIGMERTLHVGMALNLLLALMMLIVSAAESEESPDKSGKKSDQTVDSKKQTQKAPKKDSVPVWHAVTVYILAPLIPALAALLWLGTNGPDAVLRWNLSQMTLGVFRISLAADVLNPDSWGEPDIVYYTDGLSTTVSVERWGRHYALKNNGKVDASNGDDMPTQIMVSAFPLLMHEAGPEDLDIAIIGFGSGVTVGSTLEFPVRSVDVIELERSIPEASQFFEDVNHLEYSLDEYPYVEADRLTVINDDGRNYLASTDKTYDIIMSEPSNPWITGVSDLFTTDHFRITKKSLNPGGIYCQWVQLYELSPENIKTIYRTFASQFEHVVVFAAEDLSSDTVMLGSDSPLPLDLARLSRSFADPTIKSELERAYVHSPFDVFARVILANRAEVLSYTQVEYRLRGGEGNWWDSFWHPDRPQWVLFPESSNGPMEDCDPADCRRSAVELNTDDNALIEFAAPRDLIGFQRYEGYLANIYSPTWPYGKLMETFENFGDGDDAARAYAEMAMSLMGHGRKSEASDFLTQSARHGAVAETLVASEVLRHLLTDEHEPRIAIEPPVPGPQMDRATARQLSLGFEGVRSAVDMRAYGTALAAMEEIPAPLRLHSGPSLRFLYGYLQYKAAEGVPSRYRSAIDQLEDLVRSDEEYVRRHPELYYFLARAHDAEFNFDKGLRNMRLYVESRLVADADAEDLPEPSLDDAPTTDVADDAEGADLTDTDKDLHPDRDDGV